MLRRSLSARLGRHLERGEELMELNRAAFERNEVAFRRNEAAFRRNEEAFDRNTAAFERMMEAFDRHDAVLARNEAALDRHEAALDRAEAREDDLKIFIRDMNRRSGKVVQELVRRGEEFSAEQARRTDAIVAQLRDVAEEQKAQRQALLAVIDRLPPPAEAA